MLIISSTLKKVVTATLPLCIGVFCIMFVQMVDAVYIGRLGVDELAVHGMMVPFSSVFTGIQVGIGVAAISIISKALGAKDEQTAKTTTSLYFTAGLLFIAVVCLTLFYLKAHIFNIFVSSDIDSAKYAELFAIFSRYWPFWLFSCLMTATLYFTTCVYRANGDNKKTGSMFVASSALNFVLDPLFIFVFDMGIVGAAIASAISFSATAIFMLYKAKSASWFNRIHFDKNDFSHFQHLVKLTLPTMVNQFLPSISAFLGMYMISRLGTDSIAFWSMLLRVESFLLMFTLALTMSIPPMISFYLGANKIQEIDDLVKTTAKFLIASHITLALLLMLGLKPFVSILSTQPLIQDWLYNALLIIPLSYGPLGLCMVVVSSFNALGEPKRALLVSFIRLFVFYIPAIYTGTSTGDIQSTVIAASIANLCAGTAAWLLLSKRLKTLLCNRRQSLVTA